MSKRVANGRGSSKRRRNRRAKLLLSQLGHCYLCVEPLADEPACEIHKARLGRNMVAQPGNKVLTHERCGLPFGGLSNGDRQAILNAGGQARRDLAKKERVARATLPLNIGDTACLHGTTQ